MDENEKDANLSTDDLIRKNLEISQEILGLTKYIKRYIFWRKIMTWLKVALIAVPIILAIVYLPPFLQEFSSSIQEFMGLFSDLSGAGVLPESLEK